MPLIFSDLEGLFPCHSDETFHISSGTGWFSAYLDAICRKWVKGQSNLSSHYITFSIQKLSGRAQTLLRTLERSWPLAIPAALAFHSYYHQNHGEKKKQTDAREKQGKDILPSLPAGTFPRSERLGQLEFARTFFHLSTKPHHKMLQFLFLVCLLVCSTFVFGKIILEAGTGDFNSCSSSRLGGWNISALLLRKAGTKICWRLMRKRGCIVWTALSTRVHLCTHPCELLQLDSVEVGCKGRKKRKKKGQHEWN